MESRTLQDRTSHKSISQPCQRTHQQRIARAPAGCSTDTPSQSVVQLKYSNLLQKVGGITLSTKSTYTHSLIWKSYGKWRIQAHNLSLQSSRVTQENRQHQRILVVYAKCTRNHIIGVEYASYMMVPSVSSNKISWTILKLYKLHNQGSQRNMDAIQESNTQCRENT